MKRTAEGRIGLAEKLGFCTFSTASNVVFNFKDLFYLFFLTNVLGIQILVPLGKERVVLWSIVAGAVTDVVLNVLLIPRFGASGAAAATSVAELVVLAVQFVILGKEARTAFGAVSYWKLMVALAVAMGASVWVSLLGWGSFGTLLLSAVLFFGSYLGVLLALKETLIYELLMQLFKKK